MSCNAQRHDHQRRIGLVGHSQTMVISSRIIDKSDPSGVTE